MGEDYLSITISKEQAASYALDIYGIHGEVIPMPGEVDFNFQVRSASGNFLLKISRSEFDEPHIIYQQEVLEHVASKKDCSLESPVPIPDLNGKKVSEVIDPGGSIRKVRLLSWIDGRPLSQVNPVTDELLFSLGLKAGELTSIFQDFNHPESHREFEWDVARSLWTRDYLYLFPEERKLIFTYFQDQFESIQGKYSQLRKGIVHNDANDNNVIVSNALVDPEVRAIIDFGDTIHTQIINDLAIAIAYAVMGKPDVLSAALPVIEGYHQSFPLLEEELECLYSLVAMRLVISVTKAAINKKTEPENSYLIVSEKPAWDGLAKWKQVKAEHAHYSFRHACRFFPHPADKAFRNWIEKHPSKLSSLFPGCSKDEVYLLDLSVSSNWLGLQSELEDIEVFQFKLERFQSSFPEKMIAGGYLEPRTAYRSPAYDKPGNYGAESRTIHLGIDFWVPAGTPVHALYEGTVVTAVNDAGNKEYGGLVILRHRTDQHEFYTLHGHLSLKSLESISVGDQLKAGTRVGYVGTYPENGNWASHLHFQLMLSTLGFENDFPGVAYANELEVWRSICPDPNLIFNLPELKAYEPIDNADLISYRKMHLGKSLSLSYEDPVHMVRGEGTYLINQTGRRYLDTVNNVAHVGHEHPRVVMAGQQQMAVLNTNTRYLHHNLTRFAEELLSTLPEPLSVVHFVNSGSEANELALRMARAVSGQKDMLAVEVGYHGNTSGCVAVSSYKFDGKGGRGAPEHTHVLPLPDSYRGLYQGPETGSRYASHVGEKLNLIKSKGRNVAGFICESIISCGGQIELPGNYLEQAYEMVRAEGGVCIADEVQVGCGRVGSVFWGFQLHDVVPDIVTIGKPLGNGHPVAAVACTDQVADAFANGMEYFNTFGGNPVSCAIGNSVLKVIKEEKLQENALEVGNYLKSELLRMQGEYPAIGDVRGQGLFLGIELADDAKNPLTEKAGYLVNRMKAYGILMSTDGKDDNVLKIKPPLVFNRVHADVLLSTLDRVLQEDFMKR